MAYQADWREDDPAAQGAAPGTAKQNTSGVIDGQTSPNTTSTSGTPAPGSPAPSQQGTGSGFVNLQAYMDNNKGEGGRMVNDATSGLVGDAGKFNDTVASTVADQTKAMQAATGGDKLPGLQNGLKTDATGNANAAKDFLGAGYAGPTANDADAGLAAQQKDLSDKLGAVNGDTTVATLKDKSSTPYTSGFGYLDKFLTGDQSGQDAINAVHAQAGGVNTAGDAAKTALGGSETAARQQLTANQQAVRDSAKTDLDAQAQSIAAKIAAKNATLNKAYVGTHAATAGDVLNAKDKTDLQALSDISGGQYNPNWNTAAGFNAGQVAPVPSFDSTSISASAPKTPINVDTAPPMLAGLNQKGTNAVNQATGKATAGVNAATTGVANKVAGATGDPTIVPLVNGVNWANTGIGNIFDYGNQAPATVANTVAQYVPPPMKTVNKILGRK